MKTDLKAREAYDAKIEARQAACFAFEKWVEERDHNQYIEIASTPFAAWMHQQAEIDTLTAERDALRLRVTELEEGMHEYCDYIVCEATSFSDIGLIKELAQRMLDKIEVKALTQQDKEG